MLVNILEWFRTEKVSDASYWKPYMGTLVWVLTGPSKVWNIHLSCSSQDRYGTQNQLIFWHFADPQLVGNVQKVLNNKY